MMCTQIPCTFFAWCHSECSSLVPTTVSGALTISCDPNKQRGITTGRYGDRTRWGRDLPHLSKPALGPTQPPVQFPGVKSGRGVTLTPQPLLVPWSWKSGAIPLLPLWAARPVQSLSACTSVHFTLINKCICWFYCMNFITWNIRWVWLP
jgi:hypothetical protein